jgi:hypothetical protein
MLPPPARSTRAGDCVLTIIRHGLRCTGLSLYSSRNAVAIPSSRQLPSSSSRPIRAAPRRPLRRTTVSRHVRMHDPSSGLAFGASSFWLRRLLPLPPQPEVTVGRSQRVRSR